jgi:hypothetical protein
MASVSAAYMSVVSAFFLSGRLNVNVKTPPERSMSTGSIMIDSRTVTLAMAHCGNGRRVR